jgi:hypothetical protein
MLILDIAEDAFQKRELSKQLSNVILGLDGKILNSISERTIGTGKSLEWVYLSTFIQRFHYHLPLANASSSIIKCNVKPALPSKSLNPFLRILPPKLYLGFGIGANHNPR